MQFNFNDLIVLDLANNHQGDVQHGLQIIEELSKLNDVFDLNLCIKFQFRQLKSFIHSSARERKDLPHIPRFIETELCQSDYEKLHKASKKAGFITACTPFDEDSVDIIHDIGFDIIKIASCSANDHPLLKKIESSTLPVLASTGGLTLNEIDNLYEYYKNHAAGFALHHCVSIYPTPVHKYNLNQIKLLLGRYPGIEIGWSTHEDPEDMSAVMMAVAAGATMLERHVGLERNGYKLNKYSSNPEQIKRWLHQYVEAKTAMGGVHRAPASPEERDALKSLQRGAYLAVKKKEGDEVTLDDVYFAMPAISGQLTAINFPNTFKLTRETKENMPLLSEVVENPASNMKKQTLDSAILSIKSMLREAKILLPKGTKLEISHHYGIDKFREFGAALITLVNDEYCKKLVIQLPRQKHPYHFHKIKKETFQVLFGELNLEVEGQNYKLMNGEMHTVIPNHWHKFDTLNGVIFEEISTKSISGDSYYDDETITNNKLRKTIIEL